MAVPCPAIHRSRWPRRRHRLRRRRNRESRRDGAHGAIGDRRRAARALAAAKAGARVLVFRNTVGDAVASRQVLAPCAPDGQAQFNLRGIGTLHHSRFAREDRRRLDAEVEAQFGKDAERHGGLVLVGTQTLEISLDIDADLLITDLCPADVLLQRIGRLHRHARPRPIGFGRRAAWC